MAGHRTKRYRVQYSTGSSTIYYSTYCIVLYRYSSVVPTEEKKKKNNEVTKYMYVHYSIVVVEVWGL